MKQKFIFILLQVCLSVSWSQEVSFFGADSLKSKSFEELKSVFYKSMDDKKTAKEIAFFTLRKAKKERNTEAEINSYIRLSRVTRDDHIQSLKYIDSSIFYADKYKNNDLLAESYFYKARVLFIVKNYEESLRLYIKARSYFKENNNEYMYHVTNYNIGFLKLRIKANKDALSIFKEYFEYESNTNKDSVSESYLSALYALSIAHAANENYDTVSKLNKIGFKLAQKSSDYNPLNFTHIEGGNQFLKGNLEASKDSLLKVVPYLKTLNDPGNLSISYYYLGRIYEKYDLPNEFVPYYKKVDSIFKNRNYVIQTPREAYIGLINYYKRKEDLKNQLFYIERLLKVDTVLNNQYKNLSNTFFVEYDTPELLAEQKAINIALDAQKKRYKYGTIGFFIASIILLLILRLYIKRKKKNEKRFQNIINELKTKNNTIPKSSEKKTKKQNLDITEETVLAVLKSLEEFEENEEYIKPKITVNNFAKNINTNNKYLSKIVNHYKSKSFNTYVNDLRIDYTVKKIEEDSNFRKYTLKAIAQEVGFSTTEAFTKAFKRKTGIAASYFMKKINE